MRKFVIANSFRKDYKRAQKRRLDVDKIGILSDALQRGEPLPPRCRAHKLSGDWAGHWECHIEPDWLLIYLVTEKEVILVRTGSHSDLFE